MYELEANLCFYPPMESRLLTKQQRDGTLKALRGRVCIYDVFFFCFVFFSMRAFIQIKNIIFKNAPLEHAATYSLQRTRRRACNETHQHENTKMSH